MNLYHILLMINYDAIFFSQGVVDMCYWRHMVKKRKELADTTLAPIAIVALIFMYSLTSPMNYGGMGHLFFYPLYASYPMQCLYTTGTWLWVFTIIWVMEHIANKKFNDTIYNYVTGSSLYAYVSHYFFILLLSVLVIRPYKIAFIPALFIMLFGCQLMIFLTYVPLNFLYELIVPPKPTKAAELLSPTEEEQMAARAQGKADAIEKQDGAAIDLEAENQDGASQATLKKV